MNPSIEALRRIRIGHIVKFPNTDGYHKLVEIKPEDQFVFEHLSEREGRMQLKLLATVNDALKVRWTK